MSVVPQYYYYVFGNDQIARNLKPLDDIAFNDEWFWIDSFGYNDSEKRDINDHYGRITGALTTDYIIDDGDGFHDNNIT